MEKWQLNLGKQRNSLHFNVVLYHYVKLFMKTVLVLTNIGISEAVVQKCTSCEFSGRKNTKVDGDIKWCTFPIMFQVRDASEISF